MANVRSSASLSTIAASSRTGLHNMILAEDLSVRSGGVLWSHIDRETLRLLLFADAFQRVKRRWKRPELRPTTHVQTPIRLGRRCSGPGPSRHHPRV